MTNIPGNKRIIVDADALIGLIHQDDALHDRCTEIVNYLEDENYITIIPYPTVLEAATTLSRAINRPDLAKQLLKDFSHVSDNSYKTNEVGKIVASTFNPNASKQNTPFDHYVLAIAQINNISTIFSFDVFYERNNLTLVANLL